MAVKLTLLYRGALSSCNYGCTYCPFSKVGSDEGHDGDDKRALGRFVTWVRTHQEYSFAIFFTPRGEALVHPWYHDAIVMLSGLSHVVKIAAQTNLSFDTAWLRAANERKIALWCTYHPGYVTRQTFLGKCTTLRRLGISHSVGMVGLKEHLDEIRRMRAELDPETYLWVNAFKRTPNYYSSEEATAIEAVDPLFGFSNTRYTSFGQGCQCGSSVFSVDHLGDVRRCHFAEEVKGNIFIAPAEAFTPSAMPCPNNTCSCHIGYVHLDRLGLSGLFGEGILERVPVRWPHMRADS